MLFKFELYLIQVPSMAITKTTSNVELIKLRKESLPMNTPDVISTTVYDLILASPLTKILDVEPQHVLSEIKMDSLEKLSMAMDLEEAFNRERSDEDIEDFETVSDYLSAASGRKCRITVSSLGNNLQSNESLAPQSGCCGNSYM
jgi:acyl carrier protein